MILDSFFTRAGVKKQAPLSGAKVIREFVPS
jgi:hypothetical protein